MSRRYVTAAEVLPEDLLFAVSKAVNGRACYMWLPAMKSINRARRDAYVVHLCDEGNSAAEIADQLFISERTVWRILAREKAHSEPSAGAAGTD